MTSQRVYTLVLGLLPCLIPPYALRLNRVFGAKRVGWALFTVFSLLALLQVVRAWMPPELSLDAGLTLDLLSFLVPVLLLISMIHIETLFKERLRLESEEKRLRSELQAQVQDRTTELDGANEELQRELSLRKQGEEELRKSKEQYRFLFDENPHPMWIYDLNTFEFLAFNAATLRHYGFTRDEFRQLTIKDLCPPPELDAFTAESSRPGQGAQRRGVWRHRRKDGSVIEVQVTSLDLIYAGCPARLVLANDVTAERMLQKHLLQSQKLEVTAQLAGGVADRFNRLISAIETEASALAQSGVDAKAVEPLKRIAATAASAAGLTHQLLALVGRHPMQSELLDLNQFIENQTGALLRMIGSQIRFEKVCWAQVPPIIADPMLIQQVLYQLVLNARDAMPQGGKLTVSTAALRVDEGCPGSDGSRAGAFVSLEVADTGSGMTSEVETRLFEPFFTTKDTANAAGLGLATVQGLVKQHGGWIEVKTQPGCGSCFTVFFPAHPTSTLNRRAINPMSRALSPAADPNDLAADAN